MSKRRDERDIGRLIEPSAPEPAAATATLESPVATAQPTGEAEAVAWAQSVLGDWIDQDRGGIDANVQYAVWHTNAPQISLDGSFTPDQLEAMAIWMRAKKK